MTLQIRKKGDKGRPPQEVSYYAPIYFPYYKSDERIRIPEKSLMKAVAEAYAGVEE